MYVYIQMRFIHSDQFSKTNLYNISPQQYILNITQKQSSITISAMSSSNFKYSNNESEMPNTLRDEYSNNNHQNENLQEESRNQPQNIKLLGKEKEKDRKQGNSKKIGTSDTNPRNKLIEQHTKLKGQLKELASKMDQIVQKQKERKKKKNIVSAAQEDERVGELRKELREQETRIQKNKTEITRLRKNLDNKYDINKIVEKENQLKHLKKQLQNLEEEKQALQKIRKTQDRAIRNGEDRETTQKISKMEQQLKQLTHKTKKQVESINQKQKQIRKLHEAYIVKQEKVRQIEAKAKQKKANGQEINEYTIAQLEDEIKALENERLQVEKEGNQRVRALERERKDLKQELERKKLILDQKQKELRLNQMKHKQIVRLINSNPQQQKPKEQKQKEKKPQVKRVVAKKGRQAPKMQTNQDVIDDN